MEGRRSQRGRELTTPGINFCGRMNHWAKRGDGSSIQRDPNFLFIDGRAILDFSHIVTSGGEAGATEEEAASAGRGGDIGVGGEEWVA